MKVFALSGSSGSKSINAAFLRYVVSLAAGDDVTVASVRDYEQPFFSVDLENERGIPRDILRLHAQIQEADAMILASPEYNGGAPAMLKNAIDWLSRMPDGANALALPVLLLSTSPGARGGLTNITHLADTLPRRGAKIVGPFALGSFDEAFDTDAGEPRDPQVRSQLALLVAELRAAAHGA